MTFNTASIAALSDDNLVQDPSPKQLVQASSVHVLAFSSQGQLIMEESEGSFDLPIWDKIYDEAKKVCCKPGENDMDEDRHQPNIHTFVERVIEAKVDSERGWKNR